MARFYLLLFYSGVVFRSFCICISSWHKDYLRGRKHKTKLNPCHSFCTNVSGLSSWGNYYWKNIAESAGKKARSCSPSKTGTRILHGEGRGKWGSDVLCPLSPENREGTGWTVGAGLPQVSGCMFMAVGLTQNAAFWSVPAVFRAGQDWRFCHVGECFADQSLAELSDAPWLIFPLIFCLNFPLLILILLFLFIRWTTLLPCCFMSSLRLLSGRKTLLESKILSLK